MTPDDPSFSYHSLHTNTIGGRLCRWIIYKRIYAYSYTVDYADGLFTKEYTLIVILTLFTSVLAILYRLQVTTLVSIKRTIWQVYFWYE